jgi:hypothetical protein
MPIPFGPAARLLTRTFHPATRTGGVELQLPQEGVLVTHNHFSAPDYPGFWNAIHVSAAFPVEIHWIVAGGWNNSGWMNGITHWLFPRGAKLLGWTSMPPMPPDPAEAEQRAEAVRHVLNYAAHTANPIIGLTPEGGDTPGGVLWDLYPGTGRFIQMLCRYCPWIIPIGVWSEAGEVRLEFGEAYRLQVPGGLTVDERDQAVGEVVMRRIAELLPERLRGKYGKEYHTLDLDQRTIDARNRSGAG